MSQRRAVTKATATRYRSASKGAKALILDELCATTGWHRDHALKALRQALGPRRVAKPRKPRPPTYDDEEGAALGKVWTVMGAPAGKRMAPLLPEMVARLRVRAPAKSCFMGSAGPGDVVGRRRDVVGLGRCWSSRPVEAG